MNRRFHMWGAIKTFFYKIPNKMQDPLLVAHNFSNVPSTMRT
jgi:hypothetical protein